MPIKAAGHHQLSHTSCNAAIAALTVVLFVCVCARYGQPFRVTNLSCDVENSIPKPRAVASIAACDWCPHHNCAREPNHRDLEGRLERKATMPHGGCSTCQEVKNTTVSATIWINKPHNDIKNKKEKMANRVSQPATTQAYQSCVACSWDSSSEDKLPHLCCIQRCNAGCNSHGVIPTKNEQEW